MSRERLNNYVADLTLDVHADQSVLPQKQKIVAPVAE